MFAEMDNLNKVFEHRTMYKIHSKAALRPQRYSIKSLFLNILQYLQESTCIQVSFI